MNRTDDFILEIDKRYSELSGSSCCLSCGNALQYARPKDGEVCVDIGSGRGNDVLKMAIEVGEKGFAYGIDISHGMLEKARKSARKLGLNNVEFRNATLEDLGLHDSCADLVISNCTINHAKNKENVWKEIHRILKKGGRFVVSDIFATEKVPDEYANDPAAVAECWAGAVTKDQYLKTLQDRGFIDIQILEESTPYPKGKIEVASFTVIGWKKLCCCGCN